MNRTNTYDAFLRNPILKTTDATCKLYRQLVEKSIIDSMGFDLPILKKNLKNVG